MRRLSVALLCLFCCALTAQNPAKPSSPDAGTLSDGVYRNRSFAFTYKPPYGWVDRTSSMNDDKTDPAMARVLLAVFEQPPEAKRETVNSAVVITVESLKAYPGLKTAADYFGPLSETAQGLGFKMVSDPYSVTQTGKSLVRADFKNESGKQPIYQISLAYLSKGYAVSFMFIGGSIYEVEQLREGLSFAAPAGKH